MKATKTNHSELTNEINRATIIMQYAVEKFLGFKVPSNIADAYIAAKDENDYHIARRNLENVLVGFFKKSDMHFTKRLTDLKVDFNMTGKKLDVMKEIQALRAVAAEKWIDPAKAGDIYFGVHQMIEQLVAERDIREKLARLRYSGVQFDADLSIKMKTIHKQIDALRYVTDFKPLNDAFDILSEKAKSIMDAQKKRLDDRQRARTYLRMDLVTAKTK